MKIADLHGAAGYTRSADSQPGPVGTGAPEPAEAETSLPANVVAAFEQPGRMQRGQPELAMLGVQKAMGGGVLNPVVEHVGDIIHRMSHLARWGTAHGQDKIAKTLRWLTHPYGFEREMQENMRNNAKDNGIPANQFAARMNAALLAYAAAHARLPVYNRAQWLARQAAISVGRQEWNAARTALQALAELAQTPESYTRAALSYHTDHAGCLRHYTPGM